MGQIRSSAARLNPASEILFFFWIERQDSNPETWMFGGL